MSTASPTAAASASASTPATPSSFSLPLAYRLFFLTIEPISALLGSYYAHSQQRTYLSLTHSASAPASTSQIPQSTSIVLTQLANLYLLFAINEALVLRSTTDIKVWRTVLFCLLLADFGHLYSCWGAAEGGSIYWRFWGWNAIDWGNIGFVYVGAAMRCAFLARVGFGGGGGGGRVGVSARQTDTKSQ